MINVKVRKKSAMSKEINFVKKRKPYKRVKRISLILSNGFYARTARSKKIQRVTFKRGSTVLESVECGCIDTLFVRLSIGSFRSIFNIQIVESAVEDL